MLGHLIETHQAVETKREIARVVEEAVQYAFANCGASEGEQLSEQHVEAINELLWEKIEPYLLHLLTPITIPSDTSPQSGTSHQLP